MNRRAPIPYRFLSRQPVRRACIPPLAFVLAVLLVPAFPSAGASPAPASVAGPSLQPPSLEWGYNIRVTRNPGADLYPQVVGLDYAAGLTWESSRGPGGTYFVKVNSAGNLLSAETFVGSERQSRDEAGRPVGPRATNDSRNLALVGDNGTHDVKWVRFDDQANLLGKGQVGANDTLASRSPAIARGFDGRLLIVRADCDPSCWRILLTVVYTNGTQSAGPVDLSSNLSSDARFATIVANANGTRFAVAFGSANGTFVESMDGEGNLTGGPLLVRAAADHKIVRPVWGANGTLHIVWNDSGGILYSRIGANSTFEAENLTIASSASARFPAAVVRADGSLEVFFSETGTSGLELRGMTLWGLTWNRSSAVYNLSAWSGDSYDPDAALLSTGMVAVTWTETRDGNTEVYMAFGSWPPMQLEASGPLAIALPRGQNRTLEVDATSWLLGSTQNFTANWTLASGTGSNLTIAPDASPAPAKGYGQRHTFSAVVTARPWAAFNESFHVNVTVNSSAAGGSAKTLSFNVTAIWPAEEQLLAGQTVKYAWAGESVNFSVLLRNWGLFVDTVDLRFGSTPGARWTAALDTNTTQVPALGSYVPLVVTVGAPQDGWMLETGCFELRADSRIDPYGNASLSLCVGVKGAGYTVIEVPSGNSTSADPGTLALFEFEVLNTLNLPPGNETPFNASASFLPPNGPAGFWFPWLDVETFVLPRDGRQTIRLAVAVPINALAGVLIRVQVFVMATKFGTADSEIFEVTVGDRRDLDLRAMGNDSNPSAGWWSYDMEVSNPGNRPENVSLAAADPGSGFAVRITVAGAPVSQVSLLAGQSYPFTVWVSAPTLGLAGPYGTTITADAGEGLLRAQGFTWVLPVRHALGLNGGPGAIDTTGGQTVVWRGNLTSTSNEPTLITFTVTAPWPGAGVRVGFDGAAPTQPAAPGNLSWTVGAQPFQIMKVKIDLAVPRDAAAGRVAARIGAQLGNLTTSVNWSLTVLYSNPSVRGLEITPPSPAEGDLVVLSFTVRNGGDLTLENFTVEVRLDGVSVFKENVTELGPLVARLFYAQANLSAGDHTFEVFVDEGRSTPSDDWSNASASLNISVPAPPQAAKGFLPDLEGGALLALATVALGTARLRRGRR